MGAQHKHLLTLVWQLDLVVGFSQICLCEIEATMRPGFSSGLPGVVADDNASRAGS